MRTEAAAGKLCGRAGEPDSRHCGIEPHKEGLHSGPGTENGGILLCQLAVEHGCGEERDHRGLQTDNEIEQRQLQTELNTGRDEANKGEGSDGNNLRTYAGGRHYFLRLEGGEQPGGLQAHERRHHSEQI